MSLYEYCYHSVMGSERFAFRRGDGKFMRVERDTMPNCMWAEWTDEISDATLFPSASGMRGDHRWERMSKGCEAVRVEEAVSRTVKIA